MNIGDRIRRARQAMKLSQAEVARRAKTTQSAIARYEVGSSVPNGDTSGRILRAIGYTPSMALQRHRDDIRRIASEFEISEIRVFGSTSRNEDTAESDLDFLVRFAGRPTLLAMLDLQDRLESVAGTSCDVISAGGLRPTVLTEHRLILAESVAV